MILNNCLQPDWPAPANIKAATTLRKGGFSTGQYHSLNLAMHVGDDVDKVQQNRALIQSSLNLPAEPVWLEQVHGNKVVNAATAGINEQADASYSDRLGVVCAVMTADCLPLLLCDTEGSCIAAVHAGWRGLLAGVIANTVKAMNKDDLLVWLGPAIGPTWFQVGREVKDAFVNQDSDYSAAFTAQSREKWLADIYQLAKIHLAALGITGVYGGDFCTYSEPERFYSYRRDRQTGRMTTLIWRD